MIGTDILLALLAMLLLGKLLGDFIRRLGFSALIGYMLAGILLGPMCLGIVQVGPEMDLLAGVAILFMMFLMGLSVDLEKVMGENVYKAALITLCGGTLTFLTTSTITALLGFPVNTALLVGVSFISTSTAIGFMVLSGFGDTHSKVFKTIMAVGITDDVYAILALALFTMYLATGVDIRSAFSLFLLVLGFIIVILGFGRSFSDRLINYSRGSPDEQSIISFSLILLFLVAFLSQSVQIASVTGAFLAGTILARSPLSYKVITPKIEAVSEGLFVPIFFVYTGARINVFDMLSSQTIDLMVAAVPLGLVLFLGLLMAVMASKFLGTTIASLLIGGYSDREITKMSLVMMPMGEYTLVIGQIGLIGLAGVPLLGSQVYSAMALVVLTISIIAPILLRTAYNS